MSVITEHEKLEELVNMPRSAKVIENITYELKRLLGYDYEIGKIQYDIFAIAENTVNEKFGQVATPEWVASLMVELSEIDSKSSVLDPCFGNGVFLTTIHKKIQTFNEKNHSKIVGIELDPVSFARGVLNYKKTGGHLVHDTLFNGSIFDWKEGKFDTIIMNPPYIRQEELSNLYFDKKMILEKTLESMTDVSLSARSNLYSYFILHLTKFLKSSGTMSVIIPKVWLDSKYGQSLQEFLLSKYEIEFILDFANDTFSSVVVEDCILVLKKTDNPSKKHKTHFVHVKKKGNVTEMVKTFRTQDNFEDDSIRITTVSRETMLHDSKWGKFLHVPPEIVSILTNKKMTSMSNLVDIVRGTTTFWNDFFMMDDSETKSMIEKKFCVPIIKSPKDIMGFDTSMGSCVSTMIHVKKPLEKISATKGIRKYIQIELSEKRNNLPTTVTRMISKNSDSWYTEVKTKSGAIIFSYIIRRMKNFVLNSMAYNIRDNFYIIDPKSKIDIMLIFGILNSSIVKLNLEMVGRRYGNGLLKVQAYELKNMLVPDLRLMDDATKNAIKKESARLSKCRFDDKNVGKIIGRIDQIVCDFLKNGLTPDKIMKFEKDLVENRLQRPNSMLLS